MKKSTKEPVPNDESAALKKDAFKEGTMDNTVKLPDDKSNLPEKPQPPAPSPAKQP